MLPSPDTLFQDRYHLIRMIAQGRIGAIYEAHDRERDTIVALKYIRLRRSTPTRRGTTTYLRETMNHESRLLMMLRHSVLPRVLGYGVDEDAQFLVMEFVPGEDLRTKLLDQGTPFALDQVIRWADQLLDALDYLHTHQPPVLHLDIKPQNLKLSPTGDIRLLDFGIGKHVTAHIQQLTTVQSARGYQSPYVPFEQIQGMGVDLRSDLYAVAGTLSFLLTGQAPTDALTRADALLTQQPDPLRPVSDINPEIPMVMSLVLHQAMAQKIAQRFTSATAMRSALRMIRRPLAQRATQQEHLTMPISSRPSLLATPPRPLPSLALTEVIVDQDGHGAYETISEAIARVAPGTRLLIQPGTYHETLVLEKHVEIIGQGPPDQIIIERHNAPCVLMQTESALIKDVSFRGTVDDDNNHVPTINIPMGALQMEGCRFTSESLVCIAIAHADASPTLRRCTIAHCRGAGIIAYAQATGLLDTCDIAHNADSGIIIRQQGSLMIQRCKIHHNGKDGIRCSDHASGTIDDCDIFSNRETGIHIKRESQPLIRSCRIYDHTDGWGILVHEQGLGRIDACDIFENGHAAIQLEQSGNPLITQCKIAHEHVGIIITNEGLGTIEECDIGGSSGTGVEILRGANPTIRHTAIHDGQEGGVRIDLGGRGTLDTCEIFSNLGVGVQIGAEATPMIRRCMITENGSAAILVGRGSSGTVEWCDLSGNVGGAWSLEPASDVQEEHNRT